LDLIEFEQLTDQHFGFLSAEHSYEPQPPQRGGRFGTAFIRSYVRGNLEIGVSFGDVDSHHLCSIWFNDDLNEEIARRSYKVRDLSQLLASRNPSFDHPTAQDLSGNAAADSVIARYGTLLRDFAVDLLRGDYSAFPKLVYALHHIDRHFPGGEVHRFLGVYSTYEQALAAIAERQNKRGYVERLDGFELSKVDLDGLGFWYAGIALDSARQS
jgi:hypothetical protein